MMTFRCTIESMSKRLNVLFLAAEAEPYIKIGGLGDVAGSLPLALRALAGRPTDGLSPDVRLVLPVHGQMIPKMGSSQPIQTFTISQRRRNLGAQVYEQELAGMPVYLIDGEAIAAAPSVYSGDPAQDQEKYVFFSLAALEMVKHLDWRPDIVHANDWHTALALYALRKDPFFAGTRALLGLHNLLYMGGEAGKVLASFGLKPVKDKTLPKWARNQPLAMGLWAADAIVAVSRGYAREILTPEQGCGLEGFLHTRAGNITGILNGLDTDSWDPQSDGSLGANYSAENLEVRATNKSSLQERLSLSVDPNPALLALVARLDPQKGVDLAMEALRHLQDLQWQAVFLGTGEVGLEEALKALEAEMPGRVRAVLRYAPELARLVYAGADILMVPSRYEPCGLVQMIAMRYGCVPVVRAIGGLKDTVKEKQTGFLFKEASSAALARALQRALTIYAQGEEWRQLQYNGMQQDLSWSRSARKYLSLYRSLVRRYSPIT